MYTYLYQLHIKNPVLFGDIVDGIKNAVKGFFQSLIENIIYRIFWMLEVLLCRLIGGLEHIMEIFTGEEVIKYNGSDSTLIDVFFTHQAVRGIYGGIALIGIVFAFVFTIAAVIRRALDLRGKQQGITMGIILGNLLKSILIIASMNLIVIIALDTTSTLTKQVSIAVQNGGGLGFKKKEIVFTDEQYAAMGRIINTIGNYSLNPSYRSRYNLNACYNDIRGDLKYLQKQGVFEFHYSGEETWQSVIEDLAKACSFKDEAAIDAYDDGITNAVLNAMERFKANPDMKVLKSYQRDGETGKASKVPMDNIMFLIGTMGMFDGGNGTAAARNPDFNKNPSFFDAVRLPFYTGEQSIGDFDAVKATFDLSPFKTNYLLVFFTCTAVAYEMVLILITCTVRIFNLLTLYISAPLFIAAYPLDDGGKFKQWTTAFIIQLLGVVGMVLSLRLFLMFVPIIWSNNLVISSDCILNLIGKLLLFYGAITAVNKVNGILTGILADNAGYQAILAGNMRDDFKNSAIGKAMGGATATGMAGAAKEKWDESRKESKEEKKAIEREEKGDQRRKGKEEARQKTNDTKKAALQADLKHMQKHGKHTNGQAATEKDKHVAKKALDYMDGGKDYGDAMRLANKDWETKDRRNHEAPADRRKAMQDAQNMNQEQYGALAREYNHAQRYDQHIDGSALQSGWINQAAETLRQYESMHENEFGQDDPDLPTLDEINNPLPNNQNNNPV